MASDQLEGGALHRRTKCAEYGCSRLCEEEKCAECRGLIGKLLGDDPVTITEAEHGR